MNCKNVALSKNEEWEQQVLSLELFRCVKLLLAQICIVFVT